MKSKEITPGVAYVVEWGAFPTRRLKATALEAPVLRNDRRDGALVRFERAVTEGYSKLAPGDERVVALTKVLRPWTAEDDAAVARHDERVARMNRTLDRAVALGLPLAAGVRGIPSEPPTPGIDRHGLEAVTIDLDAFEPWLDTIARVPS